jgi:RNA polymerase sigma factor (TIGR02999 family)
LLRSWQDGDEQAFEKLSPFVYQELRRLARNYMASESPAHTLQPTALVNEAFIRLVDGDIDYQSRKHFFVVAARMMRRVLVDHARARARVKRGDGAAAITYVESVHLGDEADGSMSILSLDEALSSLAESDTRMASAVELIFFGGLSIDDAAGILDVSPSTVYEDVRFAKAWIKNAMG